VPEHTVKILLVDDDQELLELLSFVVQRAGLRPMVARDGASALKLLDEQRPDLLVLDVRLGDGDGLQVLEAVRRCHTLPVIMLSALDSEDDKVRALELGADDYVTKPFAFRELVARIRAGLRKRAPGARPVDPADHWLCVGPLALNPLEHRATLEGLPLLLTVTEFRLLQLLMRHPGRIVPHRALLKQIWGYDDPADTDVVRATVYRLRRKLGESSDQPPLLRTVPGVGVVLQSGPDQPEAPRPVELDDRFAPVGDEVLAASAA
jgi:two-component system, OmpR family, response regulator VicR